MPPETWTDDRITTLILGISKVDNGTICVSGSTRYEENLVQTCVTRTTDILSNIKPRIVIHKCQRLSGLCYNNNFAVTITPLPKVIYIYLYIHIYIYCEPNEINKVLNIKYRFINLPSCLNVIRIDYLKKSWRWSA